MMVVIQYKKPRTNDDFDGKVQACFGLFGILHRNSKNNNGHPQNPNKIANPEIM